MDNAQDVTQESSPAQGVETPTPAPAPVSAALPQDRPVENVLAEMNRKYTRLENQIGNVLTLLSQSQVQNQAPKGAQATDEELWALAQQGDRSAFELYQERIADRRYQQKFAEQSREASVNQQLNSLATRYPVFNDSTHPLTQTVQSAYQIMVSQGYPANRATLLDAMKTAIADRPDLVADMVGRPGEVARVSATRRAQAGQTGATVRETPLGTTQQAPRVSAEQAQLASRIGVKDPSKAIERFKQRQASGASQFGQVANFVTEEL